MASKATSEPAPTPEWTIWSAEVINGQLNPVLLDVAKRGYNIQSEVLHIPEEHGIFSSGPPRLQVHEGGAAVVAFYATLALGMVFAAASLFVLKTAKSHARLVAAILLVVGIMSVIELYIALVVLCARRRVPGYVWDDWEA